MARPKKVVKENPIPQEIFDAWTYADLCTAEEFIQAKKQELESKKADFQRQIAELQAKLAEFDF